MPGGKVVKNGNEISISVRKQRTLNYLRDKGKLLLAQGADLFAVAVKILLGHFQLVVMAKYLWVKWSGSMLGFFSFLWETTTLFSTLFSGNKCMLDIICTSLSPVYCKTILIFCVSSSNFGCPIHVWIHPYISFTGKTKNGTWGQRFYSDEGVNANIMDQQLSILNQSVFLTMIIILYYMYTSICVSIFTLNQCRQYGSHGLWHVEDLDISCNTDTHFWHVLGISIPGYLFYVFGIPAAIIYCVYTNKNSLSD